MILPNHCGCGLGQFLVRSMSIRSGRECNPYKVLGLNPTATQAEIKSAFYELSKKHHPDKNQGCEKSAKKFKDITAAYEILRNEKQRLKFDREYKYYNDKEFTSNYDKQFYSRRTSSANSRVDYNDDAERDYYEKTNPVKNRKFYGKTRHYNYDAWYKAHYENSFSAYKNFEVGSEFKYKKPNKSYSFAFEFQGHKGYLIALGLFITYIYSFVHK